jgi:tRNA (guanine-N7-)-methyltransferase
MVRFPQLSGPLPVPQLPAEHDLDYRTHFERRMRLHGLPVYRAEFRKERGGELGTPKGNA